VKQAANSLVAPRRGVPHQWHLRRSALHQCAAAGVPQRCGPGRVLACASKFVKGRERVGTNQGVGVRWGTNQGVGAVNFGHRQLRPPSTSATVNFGNRQRHPLSTSATVASVTVNFGHCQLRSPSTSVTVNFSHRQLRSPSTSVGAPRWQLSFQSNRMLSWVGQHAAPQQYGILCHSGKAPCATKVDA